MRVGSLFAGIGGFDLGFERAGMQTVWQVEQNAYCRAVLAKHFPDAQRFEDVRAVGAGSLEPVDLICGGFPCTDLSVAGRGAGIDGSESGLWSEFARLIRELRPHYVVVENVPDLLVGRGKRWSVAPVGRVLGDLSEIGYDAEWSVLSAQEFGAPHLRERVWIVAYPAEPRLEGLRTHAGQQEVAEPRDRCSLAPDEAGPLDDAGGGRHGPQKGQVRPGRDGAECPGWWRSEPDVGRVAHGIPSRVDRVAALGNSLVPQIAEWIGRRILEAQPLPSTPRRALK